MRKWILVVGLFMGLTQFFPAFADDRNNKWSLSDWLETRDKMRVMDMWLALHSPSPYEFFVGGNYQQSLTPSSTIGWSTEGAAYASIIGLEYHYENLGDARMTGLLNVRIFGYRVQATNLTLQVGVRDELTAPTDFRNFLAGASFTLYFSRFFGVDGLYRHFFSSTPTPTGASMSGDRFQGEGFIDFSFLRVYGQYFYEPLTTATTTGFAAGTKIFF